MEVRQIKNEVAELFPKPESLALGACALLVVETFRAEFFRSIPLLIFESFIGFSIPIVMLVWIAWRGGGNLKSKAQINMLRSFAVLYSLIPFATQFFLRQFSQGDAGEIVALQCLAYAAWYAAVFSAYREFGKASFALGCALVLFVCFMATSGAAITFAVIYLAVALWWLLADYWGRIQTSAIDAESKTLLVRGWVFLFTAVGLLGVLGIAYLNKSDGDYGKPTGFAPFSGGDHGDWQDSYARSGIGDGNMLTGGPNATTTGAVDSDNFIEDDKPSMYDVQTDKYDGPVMMKKRRNRAIALDAKAKHMHNVIQSEQSGRSFRTVRERTEKRDLDLENRFSNALFMVEGSVPARFAVDAFLRFDGWDWKKPENEEFEVFKPRIDFEQHGGKPWYVASSVEREYLTTFRSHRLKIMNYGMNSVPAAPLIKSWHIHRSNIADLFYYDDYGVLKMSGEMIARQTMIDTVSQVPNFTTLRDTKKLQLVDHPNSIWEWTDRWLGVGSKAGTSAGKFDPREEDPDSLYVQIPDDDFKERLKLEVEEIIAGYEPGWEQVEAIVNHLRSQYRFDPDQVADPECVNSVEWFLDNGSGPAYLFATTAIQMLRTAGYKTRLARGFLVTSDDYDRIARQSQVTSENWHVWPEVCLDGWHWLPTEPTPGFPPPFSHQTLMQKMYAGIIGCINTVIRNPIRSIIGFLLACGLLIWRREIALATAWLMWRGAVLVLPRQRVAVTGRYLDFLFWVAGRPRPKSETIPAWYAKTTGQPDDFFNIWNRRKFSTRKDDAAVENIKKLCLDIVAKSPLKRFVTTKSKYRGVANAAN